MPSWNFSGKTSILGYTFDKISSFNKFSFFFQFFFTKSKLFNSFRRGREQFFYVLELGWCRVNYLASGLPAAFEKLILCNYRNSSSL